VSAAAVSAPERINRWKLTAKARSSTRRRPRALGPDHEARLPGQVRVLDRSQTIGIQYTVTGLMFLFFGSA
jgi:hypothetical protein